MPVFLFWFSVQHGKGAAGEIAYFTPSHRGKLFRISTHMTRQIYLSIFTSLYIHTCMRKDGNVNSGKTLACVIAYMWLGLHGRKIKTPKAFFFFFSVIRFELNFEILWSIFSLLIPFSVMQQLRTPLPRLLFFFSFSF